MDMKEFHKVIPAECLPREYDGVLPDLETLQQETVAKLRNIKALFLDAEEEQRRQFKEKRKN